MKRILALLLAVVAVISLGLLSGCAGGAASTEEDQGAEISAFFVGEVYDFDPAKAYTNDDAMKLMSLIYEPLFSLDANGNVQYALANGYRFYEYRGEHYMEITLRDSYWNDGTQVKAEDVADAWWRILDPDFPCQAATLLYEIKNARAAKLCMDKSVEDVAIDAQNTTLTITLEEELDEAAQQNFLRNLTSIALTPIKKSAVTKAGRDEYWTKDVPYLVTNGPFAIRSMQYGIIAGTTARDDTTAHEFRLERNNYYRRDKESNLAKDVYVTPYKFLTYWNTELTDAFTQFIEGSLFITGDIPLAERAAYLSRAQVSRLLSTYTYVLDNNDPVFSNAKVRRALSLALDRESIAAEGTGGLGIAATGMVSHGVLNGSNGSFSEANENKLATAAAKEEALTLLREAKSEGYTGGTISILIRDNEEEKKIAEMVSSSWTELFREAGISGVSVRVTAKSCTTYMILPEGDTQKITLCDDTVQSAYRAGDTKSENGFDGYNVLGIDYQMLSPDAFAVLASFSLELSGNGIHMGGIEESTTRTHVCGFNNAGYNKLIDDALAEKNLEARTKILHEAENLLLSEMPVIPLLFNRSAMLVSSELQRVYTSYYGYAVLTRAELRNYQNHRPAETDDIQA